MSWVGEMSEQATGGIIGAWLRGGVVDWANDDRRHDLGSSAEGDLVKAVKEASGMVVIEANGPLGRTFTFRRPLPLYDSREGCSLLSPGINRLSTSI
jgi:hypothetical protein